MDFSQLAQAALDGACGSLLPSLEAQFLAAGGNRSSNSPELCIAAVIGFAGADVRGTLGIAASADGLARVNRHLGGAAAGADAHDALGELANLVLGHVKRHWSRHGVDVTIATPIVVRGLAIEICGARDSATWSEYTSAHGPDRVQVWLDSRAAETLAVASEPCDDGVISEGETLLF